MAVSENGKPAVLQGRRAALLRHRGRAQARAQGRARAGQGRHLELEGPLPPAHAEGPSRGGQEADADVRRPLPAEGEEVRPAGHAPTCPTITPVRGRQGRPRLVGPRPTGSSSPGTRATRTSTSSASTTARRRRSSRRAPTAPASPPAAPGSPTTTSADDDLVHLPDRRRQDVQPDRQARASASPTRRTTRLATRRPTASAGWTDGDRSILIYDRFDIWEISPDGAKSRDGDERDGPPRQARLPLHPPRSREAGHPGERAARPPDHQRNDQGHGRLPRRPLGADGRPGQGRHDGQAARRPPEGQERRRLRPHRAALRRVPRPLGERPGPRRRPQGRATPIPSRPGTTGARPSSSTYTNADGKALPAVLIKPEDFDPAKKYPLMVYIYETQALGLHRYIRPRRERASTSRATPATATSSSARTSSTRSAIPARAR
ncbi:MAG: hypothetical protein M0C28_07385 [Candidatus Moduliflexus flocculans]|nr:hypothetical protein [Candidatus Moduliflexus flocculans]